MVKLYYIEGAEEEQDGSVVALMVVTNVDGNDGEWKTRKILGKPHHTVNRVIKSLAEADKVAVSDVELRIGSMALSAKATFMEAMQAYLAHGEQ